MIHYHIIDSVIYLWNLCPYQYRFFRGGRNGSEREISKAGRRKVERWPTSTVKVKITWSMVCVDHTKQASFRCAWSASSLRPFLHLWSTHRVTHITLPAFIRNFYTLILETRHFQLRNFDLDFDSYWNFDRKLKSCTVLFEETIQETILQQNENRGGRRRVGGGSGRAKP